MSVVPFPRRPEPDTLAFAIGPRVDLRVGVWTDVSLVVATGSISLQGAGLHENYFLRFGNTKS